MLSGACLLTAAAAAGLWLRLWRSGGSRRPDLALPALAAAALAAAALVAAPLVAAPLAAFWLLPALFLFPAFHLMLIGRQFPAESWRSVEALALAAGVVGAALAPLLPTTLVPLLTRSALALAAAGGGLAVAVAVVALRRGRMGAPWSIAAALPPPLAALAVLLGSGAEFSLLAAACAAAVIGHGGESLRRLGQALAGTDHAAIRRAISGREPAPRPDETIGQLRSERDRLLAVQAALPVGVVMIDGRGTIVAFNPAAERLFGMSGAEAAGRPALDLVSGPWAERFARALDRSRRLGTATYAGAGDLDIEVRRRNGSTFPARIALEALAGGGYVGLVRDVTRERQEALSSGLQARAVGDLAALIDQLEALTATGHYVLGPPGSRLHCSPGLLRLLGREGGPPPLSVDELAACLRDGDRNRLLALAGDPSWDSTSVVLHAAPGMTSDSGTRELLLRLWRRGPEATAEPAGRREIGIFQDLAERRRLEAALAQAAQAEAAAATAGEQATAALAGRLRPTLTTLLGLLREALAEPSSEPQREALMGADAFAGGLAALLDLVAPPADGVRPALPDEEAVDLRRLLMAVADLLTPAASARGLMVRTEVAAGLPGAVIGDIVRLAHLLLALGEAALDALPHGALLVLRVAGRAVAEPPGRVAVTLDLLPRGHQPRADEDAGRIPPLSLPPPPVSAAARALALGGMLEPLAEDGGWRLALRLARLPGGSASRPSPPPEPGSVAGGGPRFLLLVEDVEINRRVAIAFARRAGHRVEAVDSGAAAVERVRAAAAAGQPFDLVLMDIRLPDFDGTEACRRIRALPDPVAAAVPVLALTANVFASDLEAYRQAGMQGVIAKPIQADEFTRALAAVFTPTAAPSDPVPPDPVSPDPVSPDPILAERLDIAFIDERLRTLGVDTFLTILRLSRRGMEDAVEALASAAAGDDSVALGRAGHKVAGAASNFGFSGLFALGRQVERLAEGGNARGARAAASLATLDAWLDERDLACGGPPPTP